MRLFSALKPYLFTLALVSTFTVVGFGQAPIAVEDFDLAPGSLLVDNGWAAHSGAGTNPLTVVSPGLTYTGYPSSGVGNAVGLTTTGEDAHKVFPVQASGSVYAAFMVRVTEASTDPAGGYFFHLSPDPIGTTFRGRVFAKKDASNNVSFGISKALTAAADIVYTPFSYSLNTTYLLVVKYTIVDGTGNDTVQLFVNPTLPGAEPAATATASDFAQSDISVGSYALRQGSNATHPTALIDGIRIGTSWESVTTAGSGPSGQGYLDFDGDGKTDLTVVRNIGAGGSGASNQIRWFSSLSEDGSSKATDWGVSTDTFISGDYDGDGISDIAVWRSVSSGEPSGNAYFFILESEGNTFRLEDFGQTGDNPRVVGDYDGDGAADVAVYRAGLNTGDQSTWYFRGSLNNPSGNVSVVQWGSNGDFPAPGDYDGDGKNDFVIQRNNGGGQARFWMLQTTAGFDSVIFGTPTDVIVPNDFDGDGKTDIAVVRGSAGAINWYVRPSSTGVISGGPTAIFGASATDFPSVGDYDGDGKADFAIWRPSVTAGASAFWVLGSTAGVYAVPFGQNGDYPIANFNSF